MNSRSKFILSTAVALAWSTLGIANEIQFADKNGTIKTQIQAQASETDQITTASLATPLPSVTKVFGPKRPAPKTQDHSINRDEEPDSSLAENQQKPNNPFVYDPQKEPQTAQEAPARLDAPATNELAEAPIVKTPVSNLELSKAIEEAVGQKITSKIKLERKDIAAVNGYYTDHSFEPLWINEGALTPQAKSLMQHLSKAGEDGLDSRDYAVETPLDTKDAATLASFEISLSKALLHYARDAQAGRVVPSSLSRDFKLRPVYPDPSAVMLKLATSTDKVTAIASYNPTHDGYKALRQELIKLSSLNEVSDNVIVPSGEPMYEGFRGERVKALRERLNIPVLADEESEHFDATVKRAVKAFQTENNLIADGITGPKTLRAMNGAQLNRIPDIIANMERWRWMPRDLGELHVVANVPSYNVTIMKNGEKIHRTRTVVGKTKHKTPIFSDEMEFVVVNPYWNVPYSIASKELLPNIRANPGYVRSRNYEILSGGRVINPTSVNWNENSFKRLRIRQRPGGRNALGNVKFLFPNDYAIYFHDTPSKSLFQRASRAFSHGCVRIHNPFEFGDVLLKQSKGWKNGSLKKMVGGKEKWIKLKKDERIPVHITYFTAVSDAGGDISYKSDVYGHNTRLKRALGLI
ncbi:MAG: L,D-transpeptidase family protein [Hyphomicrobiales bacterium]